MGISCLKYDKQALGGCSGMALVKFPRAALVEGCDHGYRAGIRIRGHRHLKLRTCKQDWIVAFRKDLLHTRISDCGFR